MYFFRVDANKEIASGHIMRCLAIADAIAESGGDVCFLVADNNSCVILDEKKIKYINLHSNWTDLMSDVNQVKSIVKKHADSVLLIDTYKITKEYVDILKSFTKVVYLGSKKEYLGDLDVLINYSTNIDYDFYKRNYGRNTRLLLGLEYAPLRKEFHNETPVFRNKVHHIILTVGNTNPYNTVEYILDSLLAEINNIDFKIDVVVGKMFENKKLLFKKYSENYAICFYENIQCMSVLMRNSDLAISANGTTVYELSAMGVPTITFALVPEQKSNAQGLSALNVIDYCGEYYEDKKRCVTIIIDRIRYYIDNNDERIALAKRAKKLIDGNGCERIAKALM